MRELCERYGISRKTGYKWVARVAEDGRRGLQERSRAPLTCHGLPSVHGALARPVFEHAFREYGLPRASRTDNGAPFVTRASCVLSSLNVFWMRLGIQHQRIHPASPQENGAHERMHRTLKRGAIRPPRATARAQPRACDALRQEYAAGVQ